MVVLDITIVSVALPSMREALDLSSRASSGYFNAYTLTLGGFLFVGGRAGDVFGRRPVLCTGLSVFIAASLVGGLAESGVTLIVARAVQGLGAAIMAPASLSLITTTFTEDRSRARRWAGGAKLRPAEAPSARRPAGYSPICSAGVG